MAIYRGAYIYQGDRRLLGVNRAIMAARTGRPAPGQLAGEPRHGTEAGYQRHKRAGEPACQPCVEAATMARRYSRRMA